MGRQYRVTEIEERDANDKGGIRTLAEKHFSVGQEITTTELKRFCKVNGITYESDPDYNKKQRFIRALNFRKKIIVEAWG